MKRSAAWWWGQASAIAITLGMLNDYGGPLAVAAGYSISVLVDIRELLSRSANAPTATANQTEPEE